MKSSEAKAKARELVAGGMSRMEAAAAIGYGISFVNIACKGLPGQSTVKKRVRNPHVPDDDECNVHGFWVPTQEEIAREAELRRLVREGTWNLDTTSRKPLTQFGNSLKHNAETH